MSAEQTLLVFNAPKQLQFEPKHYLIRPVGPNERAWQINDSEFTTMALIFCQNGDDVNLAQDLRLTRRYLPVIIASEGNLFAEIAQRHNCGSMASNGTLSDFLTAEDRASSLMVTMKK